MIYRIYSFSLLLLRVKGRGCHTLLKPYETNCGLWIWAIQIKFDLIDWLIDISGLKSKKLLQCVFPCPLFCLSLELQREQAVFTCLLSLSSDWLTALWETHDQAYQRSHWLPLVVNNAESPVVMFAAIEGGGFRGWTGTGWVGLRDECEPIWHHTGEEVRNQMFQ